jgi:uncharacterized protein
VLVAMDASTTITQFVKMLENLDRWIEKGEEYAKSKKFESDVLVQSRLAPDQFSLAGQVQAACDTAKFAVAQLTGQAPPSHPDTEKTVAELRARIQSALSFVRTGEGKLGGAAERRVAPGWLQGKWMRGDEYLTQFAVPNFYFHVTTAYAILRHNGVELGKMDFLGSLPIRD